MIFQKRTFQNINEASLKIITIFTYRNDENLKNIKIISYIIYIQIIKELTYIIS